MQVRLSPATTGTSGDCEPERMISPALRPIQRRPRVLASQAMALTGEPCTAAPVDVRPDTAITVLDGSATGAAGQDAADHLEDAGYRQIRVGEYGASEPAATTVYYRDADVADTAQDVAARVERATGTTVSEVLESATAASSAPVVVVLRD